MAEYPRVQIDLDYERALRLSYMARFPQPKHATDWVIADLVDTAIHKAEDEWTPPGPIDFEKCPCGCDIPMGDPDHPMQKNRERPHLHGRQW